MNNEKNIIRQKMLIIRKNIINKEDKSQKIVEKIINTQEYQKFRVIAVYMAMTDEVKLNLLIKKALVDKKIVLIPKIVDKKMYFIKYQIGDKLAKSTFGVLEPVSNLYYNNQIDLVITPGLAFNQEGFRLGYGKGYYDRFFINYVGYKIGVCFSEQMLDEIPHNKLDQKVNQVINEKT